MSAGRPSKPPASRSETHPPKIPNPRFACRPSPPVLRDTARAMSQENVEIVRRTIEAWNRRDLDGALQNLHPDAEVDWSESSGVQRGVHRGIEEIRRFWEEWLDLFEEIDVRPEAFI